MARIDTYGPDLSLSNKDKLFGSSYIRTVNNIDEFETKNFTLENLKSFLDSELGADTVALKENGGIVREIISNNTYLAIDLGASDITGQLANADLANSSITINGTSVDLGGSIVIGEVSEVIAGTYLNGGGTEGAVTLNHDNTSRSDTTSTPSQSGYGTTFTAITSVTTNATGHLTSVNTATYTLPVSDNTDNYVDSIAVTGTTTKTITLGRTGALSDLTADFTDNDTIPNDATITLSAGTYISGGGDFTTDQSSAETITFNHDSTTRTDTTSSVGPNHGANFTVIDTLTSNATGHITAANVKTVTLPNGANDNTITLSAGTYLSGGGDFTVDQSFNETLTINHDSTTRSDTTSTDNNNSHEDTFTVVDSISTNATGHVTGINVKTVSFPADTNQDIDVNVSNLETRLGQIGNTSIGSAGSTITIPNLTVTGTQTINNVEVISTSSGIVFEGTSNDANETTLNVINPTADRAINLPNKSGTVALLDDIPTVNDGTLTVQGSSGLTGSGTFTANDADSPTITISHADTSSQASVNNANNDFIQDITLDDYGHITAITSATATDTITQIREDNGSYRTGSITLQSGTNVTITEPSTNVFNFAATDTNNYVTGASVSGTTTKTLTLTRQGLSNLTATWTDLDTNTDTNYYLNTASFNTGNGILSLGVTGYGTVTVDLDGRYLGLNDKAADSDLLDGVQGNQFLRSTTSPGTPGTNANTTISIGDNGTSYAYVQSHGSKPLNFNPSGNTVQVAGNRILTVADEGSGNNLDADTVDGQHASAFASSSHTHAASDITSGNLAAARNTVNLVNIASTSDATGIYFRSANEIISGEAYALAFYGYNNNDGFVFFNRDSSNNARPVFHIGGHNNASTAGYSAEDGMITLNRNDGSKNNNTAVGLTTSAYRTRIVKTTSDTIFKDTQGKHTFDGNVDVNGNMDASYYYINGTQIIDTSRNLLNIAALTMTGNFTTTGTINIPGGGKIVINNEPSSWFFQGRTTTSTGFMGTNLKNLLYCGGGSNEGFAVGGNGTGAASFEVKNNGDAYIKNSLGVNNTSPSAQIHLTANASNSVPFKLQGHNSTSVEQLLIYTGQNAGTGWYNVVAQAGGINQLIIYGNGNIQNANNSYGQISDERLKENIVPATNKLEEIKQLQVKNFNFIGDDLKQIGLIAQDVEQIFPGIVEEAKQPDINGQEGEIYKSVKYSVLVPILIKAIQELEARVAQLETP